MSYRKFGPNEVVVNTMRTHPKCEFFIYNAKVYYNDTPEQTGQFSSQVLNVPPGHVSLYEYNIDRATDTNDFIYPFVYKSSSPVGLKTTTTTEYFTGFAQGDRDWETFKT